jgi:hypothetical protein
LRFRLPVERGIKEWFFHDEDDPHHVCGWQGREQLLWFTVLQGWVSFVSDLGLSRDARLSAVG